MHYGLQQCPVESYPLSGAKNTFTCYRKWTDGGNVAPLLREDVERAKPEPTAADDLQWCVGGLDDDDEDDAEEQDRPGADSSKLTVSCSHLFSQSNSVPCVWMISSRAPERGCVTPCKAST